MVLKIHLPTESGWKFIDGIKEPTVKYLDRNTVDDVKTYHEVFLGCHKVVDNKVLLKAENIEADKERPIGLVEIWYRNGEDNNYSAILIDITTYLLSDEGKTIERIN